jgi:hypothetical protein
MEGLPLHGVFSDEDAGLAGYEVRVGSIFVEGAGVDGTTGEEAVVGSYGLEGAGAGDVVGGSLVVVGQGLVGASDEGCGCCQAGA